MQHTSDLPSNTGMQRTALCAHKIVAFLQAGIDPTLSRSSGAPPLMPNPFGGGHYSSISSRCNCKK